MLKHLALVLALAVAVVFTTTTPARADATLFTANAAASGSRSTQHSLEKCREAGTLTHKCAKLQQRAAAIYFAKVSYAMLEASSAKCQQDPLLTRASCTTAMADRKQELVYSSYYAGGVTASADQACAEDTRFSQQVCDAAKAHHTKQTTDLMVAIGAIFGLLGLYVLSTYIFRS